MCSLTEAEAKQIAKLQRDAGVERLSGHFSWPEFCDERRSFHQEFVYDVAMFAADRGFPWPSVIQAAMLAKSIFPELDGLDVPKVLSLLINAVSEFLPNLTPVLRQQLILFLSEMCVSQLRLFQAVLNTPTNIYTKQLHLEVELPPIPCPLAQGVNLLTWEHKSKHAQLTSSLRDKEEELRSLRNGLRVTLREVSLPENEQLDTQGVLELVPAAVKATEGQMLTSFDQEISLLSEILQLKVQIAALFIGRLHGPVPKSCRRRSTSTNVQENTTSKN